MSDILRRDYSGLDLSVRGDGRTVYGLAVPFDRPQRVADVTRSGVVQYDEVFRMGSFSRTIAERGERVKFLLNHDKNTLPLGRALSLREDPAGLIGEFRVSATRAGDEALELIRDGALDGLSAGFKPDSHVGDPHSGGLVERTSVVLLEVSAVAFPAYDDALIGGVRAADLSIPHQDDEAPHQGEEDEARQLVDPTFADRRRLRIHMITRGDIRS